MTELEACVLAVVIMDGPCTAYSVRKAFETSLTSTWAASTGSIYPLIRRLTKRGLLQRVDVEDDGRGAQNLTATREGIAAAKAWLKNVPDWAGAPSADPIRTRLNFISLLGPAARLRTIDKMIAATRLSLADTEATLDAQKAAGRDTEALATSGARAMQRARLDWLDEVRAFYSERSG